MSLWGRITGKSKRPKSEPVRWSIKPIEAGLEIKLLHGGPDQQATVQRLPLSLSVSELRQQPELETLELIENLWYEEMLEQLDDGYLLPYAAILACPSEIRATLGIPEIAEPALNLGHTGAVGTAHFRFELEIHLPSWRNLERTARLLGPWANLPDQSWLLLPQDAYRLLQLIRHAPDARDPDKIFAYVAEMRSEAARLGVPMDAYLEKQAYKFVNGVEADVDYDGEAIHLHPVYTSADELPETLLRSMGDQGYTYASDPAYGKVFVQPAAARQADALRGLPPVTGSDIPRFVDNPEAFLPEIEGLDLTLFGDRVKALGIRVYKAQPFVHALEKGRGWFELETGIHVLDGEGERLGEFSSESFLSLLGQGNGEDYFQWNGGWVKAPAHGGAFDEAVEKLQTVMNGQPLIDVTKLPYVLEIFENIGQLEFNQPILDAQTELLDPDLQNQVPPDSFTATLKPFQREGFVWMKILHRRRIGGLLADDMGLGKTIQVVSLLAYLHERKQLDPTLIVVPKSLLDNWVGEIDKFVPSLSARVYVHSGGARVKDPAIIRSTGITITTYQTLVRDQLAFGQVEWQAVICDEAQAIKNPSTAASKVIKAMKARFRLALTGTPVENGLSELWSIMDFVQPGLLGSLSEFKHDYIDIPQPTESDGTVEVRLLARISAVYKRRTKSEELSGQLPPKTAIELPVALGESQKRLYAQVLEHVHSKKLKPLQAIQMLRALCSHPALLDDRLASIPPDEVPKLARTLEIIGQIRDAGEKVLVFTELHRMQELLRKVIRDSFDRNPLIINGMTERRQQVVDAFNRNPGFDVMILSPKAAGTGLTITAANHVIHYTRWWNPAVENQATDRVYRIGQDKPVKVYYPIVSDTGGQLHAGTVEEIVHRILTEKRQVAESVIVSSRSLSIEDQVVSGVFGAFQFI